MKQKVNNKIFILDIKDTIYASYFVDWANEMGILKWYKIHNVHKNIEVCLIAKNGINKDNAWDLFTESMLEW